MEEPLFRFCKLELWQLFAHFKFACRWWNNKMLSLLLVSIATNIFVMILITFRKPRYQPCTQEKQGPCPLATKVEKMVVSWFCFKKIIKLTFSWPRDRNIKQQLIVPRLIALLLENVYHILADCRLLFILFIQNSFDNYLLAIKSTKSHSPLASKPKEMNAFTQIWSPMRPKWSHCTALPDTHLQ